MPKRPLLLKSGSGVPRREMERLQASIGTRLEFWIASLAVGLFAIVAVNDLAQFALGSCQGYSGVAAFERSIFGQYLELWSIDPLTCS